MFNLFFTLTFCLYVILKYRACWARGVNFRQGAAWCAAISEDTEIDSISSTVLGGTW